MSVIKKRRTIFYVLLFVFLIIFAFNARKIYSIIEDSKSTKNNLIFTNLTSTNYLVNINENEYIKDEDLGFYDTFISETVNSIVMEMAYQYEGSEKMHLRESHEVIATIYTKYNQTPTEQQDNPILWKRSYIIQDSKTEEYQSSDKLDIEEEFSLDWNFYNEEIIKFKEDYALPTTSFLELKMIVSLYGENENYILNENKEVIAKMPLTEQVFSIEALKKDSETKMIASKDIISHQREQRKLTAYIVLTIASFMLLVVTVKQINESKEKQSFEDEIEQIKKDYDEIIVETKNMVGTKDLKPVKITSFKEMLNLSDSLMLPIILFEEANVACFYIVKDDMIYVYLKRNARRHHNNPVEKQV